VGNTALKKVPAVHGVFQVILPGSKNRVQRKLFPVLFCPDKGLGVKGCRFSRPFCACNNNHFSTCKIWPGFSGGNIKALCPGKTDEKSLIFPRRIPGIKFVVFHGKKSEGNLFIFPMFYPRKNQRALSVVLGCALAPTQRVPTECALSAFYPR
jgi:hypothetical protein